MFVHLNLMEAETRGMMGHRERGREFNFPSQIAATPSGSLFTRIASSLFFPFPPTNLDPSQNPLSCLFYTSTSTYKPYGGPRIQMILNPVIYLFFGCFS